MKKIFLILSAFVFLAGCEPKIDEFEPSQGSADFSRFIVFGHSMPSGYANGALYNSGQLNSTGNILHTQLAFAGSGEFCSRWLQANMVFFPAKECLGLRRIAEASPLLVLLLTKVRWTRLHRSDMPYITWPSPE